MEFPAEKFAWYLVDLPGVHRQEGLTRRIEDILVRYFNSFVMSPRPNDDIIMSVVYILASVLTNVPTETAYESKEALAMMSLIQKPYKNWVWYHLTDNPEATAALKRAGIVLPKHLTGAKPMLLSTPETDSEVGAAAAATVPATIAVAGAGTGAACSSCADSPKARSMFEKLFPADASA